MKIPAYDLRIKWFRIPLIPFISLTEIKPEKPEAEILPIPAQVPATHVSDGRSYSDRTYHPDKRYRRGTGPLVGTERYRAIHVRRDLIQWFIDRKNRPLTMTQMRTMKKSPFRHAWVKCGLTCEHRIVSLPTLRRVLRNEWSSNGEIKGTPKVITFAKTKSRTKNKEYTLDKDFYQNFLHRLPVIGTLNVPEYQLPTLPVQAPAETEPTYESYSEVPAGKLDDAVRPYIRENSDMRR